MRKKYFLVFLVFLSIGLKADEAVYKRDTASAYFNSKPDVYIVKKIAGFISYEEYRKYLEGYSLIKIDDESSYQSWKNIDQSGIEKLLVLAKYKGGADVGSVITAVSGASMNRIGFSGEYVVFFSPIKKESSSEVLYSYTDCDAVSVVKLRKSHLSDLKMIIESISRSSWTPCLIDTKFEH